jgi:hypothetical protein
MERLADREEQRAKNYRDEQRTDSELPKLRRPKEFSFQLQVVARLGSSGFHFKRDFSHESFSSNENQFVD